MLAQIALDGFVGQQAQAPPCVAFRCIRTGQRRDFRARRTIDLNWASRAWRIVKVGKTIRVVVVTPGGDGGVMSLEGGGDLAKGFITVEFKQCGGALERLGGEPAGCE